MFEVLPSIVARALVSKAVGAITEDCSPTTRMLTSLVVNTLITKGTSSSVADRLFEEGYNPAIDMFLS